MRASAAAVACDCPIRGAYAKDRDQIVEWLLQLKPFQRPKAVAWLKGLATSTVAFDRVAKPDQQIVLQSSDEARYWLSDDPSVPPPPSLQESVIQELVQPSKT